MDQDFYTSMTHRTALVVGTAGIERLAGARVIVFGVGGVGSWCAEALARTGTGHVTVVDSDIVCATNVNRQCQTLFGNVGLPKAEEMKKRLLSINPGLSVEAVDRPYTPETAASFPLEEYDCVVDAIDSLSNKVHLLETCAREGIAVFSSMGAAARTDPSRIRTASIFETSGCPLAREVRRALRARGVTAPIPCVYSDEPPVKPAVVPWCGTGNCACGEDRGDAIDWCAQKKQINGALAHITGIFGFFLAGMVVRRLTREYYAS